ncbi:MAG: VWA domain-containing protein [Vicinamibacterales bacterium]
MRFADPYYLWLLPLLIWFWVVGSRRGGRASGTTGITGATATWWRCSIAGLLVLAAAGLSIRTGTAPMTTLFVLDRSSSLALSAGTTAGLVDGLAAALPPGDRAGLIVFGTDPVLDRRPTERFRVGEIASEVNATGTDIGAAIALARDVLPQDGSGRIVLVTDGHQTRGDALREAALATGRVRIDAVVPQGAEAPYLAVLGVRAPPLVRVNEPYAVAVDVRGLPGAAVDVTVREESGASITQPVVLGRDGSTSVVFSRTADTPGARTLVATAATTARGATDLRQEDAVGAGTVVSVAGAARVLYVARGTGVLDGLLRANGFAVTRTVPTTLPSAPALGRFDLVVLDDVSPQELSMDRANDLSRAVEQNGTGLLVLGGARSLETAAFTGSPLNALLPVDLRPRSGRRAEALGLAVVFDKSGSMADRVGGVAKIELARQAVSGVLDVLPATDALGVVAFDAEPTVVVPLEAGHDPRALDERLRAVEPSGATALAPAVARAVAWFEEPDAQALARRHLLLVTDGRTSAEDIANVQALVEGRGVEMSLVALGGDTDRDGLRALAEATGGRSFFPADVRDLPAIMAREASRVAGGTTVEEPFTLAAGAHPVLEGLDRADLPRMGGYVVSLARPSAQVALRSHLGDPVLATATAGLGRTAVFTADLSSTWSRDLRTWGESATLWVRVAQWTSRRADDAGLVIDIAQDGSGAHLVVDAYNAGEQPLTGLRGQVTISGPAGEPSTLPLVQDLPGHYAATLVPARAGRYVMTVTMTDEASGREYRALRGLYWSGILERLTGGVDRALLAQVTTATGGRVVADGEHPLREGRPAQYVDLWRWLVLSAVLGFIGEILAQRLLPGPRASRVGGVDRTQASSGHAA